MTLKRFSQLFFFLLGLLLIVYLINTHQTDLKTMIVHLTWQNGLCLILLQILAIGSTGYPLKILLSRYNIQPRHWISISFVSYLVNYLLPYRPGIAFRYFYLQKQYNVPLAEYSTVTLQYFLLLMVTGFLLLFFCWPFDHTLPITPLPWLILGFLSSAACFISVLGKKQCQKVLFVFLGYLFLYITMAACFYVAYHSIQAPISWAHALILTIVWNIVSIVPITPGNIGVSEAFFVFLSHYFLNDASTGLSAVLLFRMSQLFTTILIGVPTSFFLIGRWIPENKTMKI